MGGKEEREGGREFEKLLTVGNFSNKILGKANKFYVTLFTRFLRKFQSSFLILTNFDFFRTTIEESYLSFHMERFIGLHGLFSIRKLVMGWSVGARITAPKALLCYIKKKENFQER